MSKKSNRFSSEVHDRAVRMVLEHRGEYPCLRATIESIAPKIGCVPQTLNDWVRQHEVDDGQLQQRLGRNDQWSVQGLIDPPLYAMEKQGGTGTGDLGEGGLFRPPAIDRLDWV